MSNYNQQGKNNSNYKHGMARTPEYKSWQSMVQRCTNPGNRDFKNYGGRGIRVCDRWKAFPNFYADMGDRPEGLTIERIDNDKGYSPGNCKWVTCFEQNQNQRMDSANKTGVVGVSFDKKSKRYRVQVKRNGKAYHLGYFDTIQGATVARQKWLLQKEKVMFELIMFGAGFYVGKNWDVLKPKAEKLWNDFKA